SLYGGLFVLAAATETTLSYQAVAPGVTVVDIGPVGHPGGCDQPGRSCADATPPPHVNITVVPS
ncbi:MAG: hypothetical protein FWD74_05285, partial [Actinomycetia bacterium]|nr:hypothetical protein [Actinomycetes bacterium]